jgi:hypothetical protein
MLKYQIVKSELKKSRQADSLANDFLKVPPGFQAINISVLITPFLLIF